MDQVEAHEVLSIRKGGGLMVRLLTNTPMNARHVNLSELEKENKSQDMDLSRFCTKKLGHATLYNRINSVNLWAFSVENFFVKSWVFERTKYSIQEAKNQTWKKQNHHGSQPR